MKEQLVTYETAKVAKEKGFKDYSRSGWHYDGNGYLDNTNELTTWNDHPASSFMCDAPTQSLLQKWLREEHDIKLCISWTKFDKWLYEINHKEKSVGGFNSYEEALEKGLQKALKLI